MNDIGLGRIAIPHVGDILDVDHRAVDGLDREIAEFLDLQRRVIEVDCILKAADLLGTDRRDEVLRRQRIGDIRSGQAARLQRRWVEIDLDLTLLAAERKRDRRARHSD